MAKKRKHQWRRSNIRKIIGSENINEKPWRNQPEKK